MGAVKGNRTPIASMAHSHSTLELSPHISNPLNLAVLRGGAGSGTRTRIGGLEDRGPTFGRCPHRSCSRDLHSPFPAYQAGASLSRPEQHLHNYSIETRWSRPGSNRRPSDCQSDALPTELRPQERGGPEVLAAVPFDQPQTRGPPRRRASGRASGDVGLGQCTKLITHDLRPIQWSDGESNPDPWLATPVFSR